MLHRLFAFLVYRTRRWHYRGHIEVGRARLPSTDGDFVGCFDAVHENLRPSNILLNQAKDHAFLCDIGARRMGDPMIAEAYSAEEACEGKFSPASDVFSFGVILREIVTGAKFDGTPWLAVHDGKFDASGVKHQAIASLILDCVRRDPKARPSVDQLIDRLISIRSSSSKLEGNDGAECEGCRILFREGDRSPVCSIDAKASGTVGEALEGAGLDGYFYLGDYAVAMKTPIAKLDTKVIYTLRSEASAVKGGNNS